MLAAGAGTRFRHGSHVHKLLMEVHGARVLDLSVRAAAAAGFDEVIVVVGCVRPAEVASPSNRVRVVDNPRWSEGLASSLQVGLAAAAAHASVTVGLGDQPAVGPDAWRRVTQEDRTPISVAIFDGVRANPVRLAQAVWSLLPTSGDEGARSLLRTRPELVTEVPCVGESLDVDTVEDLRRLESLAVTPARSGSGVDRSISERR